MKKEMQKPKNKYYANVIDYAFKTVKSTENGLTSEQAQERLKEFGENVLPQKKPKSFIMMILQEFPLIIMKICRRR